MLCATLATQLTAGAARSDDLDARFGAMHRIFTRAVRDASRDWNLKHDNMRVLPVELRGMCWSYLPQSDLVRLSCVCSSWRDLSRSIPFLWSTLDISGKLTDLDVLFSRSAQLPFDVTVSVRSIQEHDYVDGCVRKHAHRVRSLHITDRDRRFSGVRWGVGLFQYPAPQLERFSLKLLGHINDDNFIIGAGIFGGHAPNLRSLTLQEIPFPAVCPAFNHLTTVVFKWSLDLPAGGLEHIFAVCPVLERLELPDVMNTGRLPHLPAATNLRTVTLRSNSVSIAQLRARGYLGIPRLEVSAFDAAVLCEAAMQQAPALHVALLIGQSEMTATEAVLRGEHGATASFVVNDALCEVPRALLQMAPTFPALARLVLPLSAPFTRYRYIAGVLRLPALRTLAISHGQGGACSLFDPDAECGTISAPLLSRIDIIAGEDGQWARGAIDPRRLALFIEVHIVCNDRAALEVCIDSTKDGLVNLGDADGIDRLRRCVGKLTFW
ncbi:hypothetical protein AURDEDRAFT_183003 [Auricularia subglabra TFB-10046 SS5]|nr:hypothetical protein AURDEDRAFT_183003 [Auricularia subglabra TFB-10046 SS5]